MLDIIDGNVSEVETDYAGSGAGGLSFVRTYNYAGAVTGPGLSNGSAGQGWSHTYERRLWFYPTGVVRALRPDGNNRVFLPSGGNYVESGTAVDQLVPVGSGTPTGWTFTGGNDTRESYDASGNLLSITYRGGATASMTYSTSSTSTSIAPYAGLLIKVADAFGHQLNLTYNTEGQIATMTDPNGSTYTYAYSGTQLNSVTYPDSTSRQYLYNESAYTGGNNIPYSLTGIIDESATRYATVSWNSSAQGTSSVLAGGVGQYSLTNLQYSASAGFGFNYFTDPLGTNRVYRYDAAVGVGKFTSSNVACPSCADVPASVTYDTNGNVASRTDFNGNETTYTYDTTRNLETSRTEASGSSSARTISTSWDTTWRQPDLVTEPTRTTAFTYDSLGNALTKTVTDTTVTPHVSRTWTYTYDSSGHMLTAKSPRTDLNSTTTYGYYSCTSGAQCGQVETVTDALGNVTTFNTYNAYGQPLTITDPNGVVTTLSYDARQRLTARQVGPETTGFAYASTGLLSRVTNPDSSYLQYNYDGAHRLTGIQDGAGNSVQYTLDAMGNRTATSTYDPSSVLSTTASRVYNSLNELYQTVGAAGTTAVTTAFSYDSSGNRTGIAAPLSRNTANVYDALNRLTQVTDPATGVTHLTYDADNDLLSVEDPATLTTSYQYNGFGEVTQTVSPATGTSTSTYDSGGNLSTAIDARSVGGTYSYDALNRVTQVVYGDQTIAYAYDTGPYGKGRMTGASDASHSMSWQYDAQGRITNRTQAVAGVTLSTSYAYTSGNLATLTTPSGQSVTFTYSNHLVTSIAVNGSTLLSSAVYDPFGPTRAWSWGNASTETRLRDSDGNPNQFTALESASYTVDSAFRIVAVSNAANSNLSWTDSYDSLDRITGASETAQTLSWTYDGDGNRVTQGGAAGPSYAASSLTMTYNNRGRLLTAAAPSVTTTYTYNALGQRIEKSGSQTRLYTYDEAGHLLGEYTSTGALVEETVWMGDIPVATLRPHTGGGVDIYYIHADHLNTPKMVTRPSDNAIMWRWDQDPFGVAVPNQNPQAQGTFVYNFRFPGQYYDIETGFSYNYLRDYDPQVGRYAESDPIGLHGGVGTYAYVGNSPLSNYDDSGLCKVELRFAPAAWVGWAGIYHAYVITTDPNGTQNVFRGGPGSPDLGGPWGNIRTLHAPYGPKGPDWPTKKPPSMLIYDDSESCGCENQRFTSILDTINEEQLRYGVYDWNSNSVAGTMLRDSGFEAGSLPVIAPGFGTNLPLNWGPPPKGALGQR